MAEKKPRKSPWTEKDLELLEKLRKIRNAKEGDFKPLPPTKHLRQEIVNLEGELVPLRLRYYQVQGILNLVSVKCMILGDGTGLGKCPSKDTLILTDRGLRTLEDLRPEGAEESGFYDLDRPVRVWLGTSWADVKRYYWGGLKPTIRVTTRSGYQLEGSLIHPLYVRTPEEEKFVKLPELSEGDYLCVDRSLGTHPTDEPELPRLNQVRPKRGFTYPTHLTPDFAALLAYVVGEGSRNPHGVDVTQHEDYNPESHADIRQLFQSVFGWEGNHSSQERGVKIYVSSQDIRRFLIACGVEEVLSAEKAVPSVVLRGTEASVRAFLAAYFEAEASVVEGGVEVSSASELLLKQVQLLLLRFGVVSVRVPKRVKGREHIYWRLTIFGESARIFRDSIGFRSTRKMSLLESTLPQNENPNIDVVPYMVGEVRALKALILEYTARSGANQNRKGSGIKQFGESLQSTFKHVLNGHRNPTYQWLRKLLEISASLGLSPSPEHKAVEAVIVRHFFYDPIVKVERRKAEVADIEVDHPSHSFVGNGLVNHNTVETIGALCYLFEKNPTAKAIVVAPKSAIRQWASELAKFTIGLDVFLASADSVKGETSIETRTRVYDEWSKSTNPAVLIMNYAIFTRDWNHGGYQPLKPNGKPDPKQPVLPGLLDKHVQQHGPQLYLIFDEATAFKSRRTKTWEVVAYASTYASRRYALTATLLKNNLMEGYNIIKAIYPKVFSTQTQFFDDYCYIEMKKVARGRIPVVLGYKNLEKFREEIELVYLGRTKHQVSNELPTLTTREIVCELNPAENAKYEEALNGLLELGDGEIREFSDTKALTSLIYCQQVVNSLALLKFKEGAIVASDWSDFEGTAVGALNSKEQALLDLLQEELEDDKVIVYTRFASHVPRLMEILKKHKIPSVCITGADKDIQRKKAQDEFQNLKSQTRVIFITAAGSEAINLQAAAAMVFYDMPWSWGDYVQAIGRMIRIGSPHKGVLCFHLLAERPLVGAERKTIDHHVLSLLRKKKNLIDKVLGEAAVGALKFEKDVASVQDLIKALRGKRAA